MALPFIQLDTDFVVGTSKVIAALLRVSRHEAIGMAADLITFAVAETSSADAPPHGNFIDPEAGLILEGAMGWTGEPGKAANAFERAGMLQKLEVGYRVRGCDRYVTAWENRQARSDAARKAAYARWGNSPQANAEPVPTQCAPDAPALPTQSEGNALAMPRNAKTETETEKKREAAAAGLTPAETAFRKWQADEWAQVFASLPTLPTNPVFAHWYRQAISELATLGKGDAELRAAYFAFLQDDFWRVKSRRRCPWSGWVKQWRDFLPTAPPAGDSQIRELKDGEDPYADEGAAA